jgi:hypothetical protein
MLRVSAVKIVHSGLCEIFISELRTGIAYLCLILTRFRYQRRNRYDDLAKPRRRVRLDLNSPELTRASGALLCTTPNGEGGCGLIFNLRL